MKFIKKNWFAISIALIFLISVFLRFYNYQNRWGLAYDQAYGAIVARYALETGKIPLLGPFSSAGPFQTGGEWYWFIMLGTLFGSGNVNSPWIFLSLSSVFFVFLMILIAKELVDKKFAVIVGLLAAVSTSQIAQSFSLTNQSIISLFSAFSILSSIKYIKTKKNKYLFLLGLNTSLAATIHLEGAALIFLVVATLIFSGLPNILGIFYLVLGLVIPTIPILLFDIQNNFVNSKNMIQYYLHDQYKISLDVLGRRWSTYLSDFWVKSLAHIISGEKIISIFVMILTSIFVIYSIIKRNLSKEWTIIVASFVSMIIFLRYLRTPLFDSYLMFAHPFIFLLIGFLLYTLLLRNRPIGILFIVIIILGTIRSDIPELNVSGNYSAIEAKARVDVLKEKFPNEKFSIYTYKYKWADKNLILGLFLYSKNMIANDGRRISVVVATREAEFTSSIISGDKLGYQLLDLNSSSSSQLQKSGWGRVNPEDIYNSTEKWYKK